MGGSRAKTEACIPSASCSICMQISSEKLILQEQSFQKKLLTNVLVSPLGDQIRARLKRRFSQIFANCFCRFSPSPRKQSIWETQVFAENRRFGRKPQFLAEKPQVGVRPLTFVPLSAALPESAPQSPSCRDGPSWIMRFTISGLPKLPHCSSCHTNCRSVVAILCVNRAHACSSRGRSRNLLETAFSEPLLRTLLRTPSENPSQNPFLL